MALRILQLNSARLYVGESAHALNLTEALRGAGHQVWLGLRAGFWSFEVATQRKLEPVPFIMQHRWWPPRDLSDMRKVAALVRDNQIDLIHAHRGKDHWLAVLSVRLFRLGVPVVRTRHVVTPLKNSLANRWQARRTARLIVPSRAVETDVRGKPVYKPAQIAFLPPGIELTRYQAHGRRNEVRKELKLAADAPVAVIVARFARVKGHALLLEAWKQVVAALPQAVLVLVGDGPLRAECEAQARTLGIHESLRFCGNLDPAKVPSILEAADLGVLASLGSEGFSRAVLEYMTLKLPVAATNVGAVPDLVDDTNGRLVPPGQPAELARIVRELLKAAPETRAQLGQAGREKAERAYSYAVWVGAHEKLYADVLAEMASKPRKVGG